MLCYLAMTAAEMKSCRKLPSHMAWMACHYAPYGTGLSNLPASLPEGAMLMINDRTPPQGHDPEYILWQLDKLKERCNIHSILLDFQQENPENADLAAALVKSSNLPVAVTESYARELECPVFLSAPLHLPLEEAFAPWKGRPIWLECAVFAEQICVTAQGASFHFPREAAEAPEGFLDTQLHCRYKTQILQDSILFSLTRTREQIPDFLSEAERLGAELAVGLDQQLGQ